MTSGFLKLGAGSGFLRDMVDDYTGFEIASSAGRYFHKPFVHGSVTSLPFDDYGATINMQKLLDTTDIRAVCTVIKGRGDRPDT